MMTLWIVLPIALILASIGVWAFLWSVRSGQLDDLDTPALRMLLEDEPAAEAGRSEPAPIQAEDAEASVSTAVNA